MYHSVIRKLYIRFWAITFNQIIRKKLVLVLVRGGWVYMNLMKHNLVQRGLVEYKSGLLSLLDRIMGRGKGYTNRGGATVTTMGS